LTVPHARAEQKSQRKYHRLGITRDKMPQNEERV
jgi:hypothetical protein